MFTSTRPRLRWAVIAIGVAALVAAACSGDDATTDEAPTTTEAGDEQPVTVPEPDDPDDPDDPDGATPTTEEPAVEFVRYELEPPTRPEGIIDVDGGEVDDEARFVGPVELIRHGVETGAWTETEGAVAVLRAQLGETPRSSVDALDLVITPSRSSLLHLAERLIDDDTTSDDERAELERLVAKVIPPLEFFDSMDPDTGEPSGFRRPSRTHQPAQASDCVEPNVSAFPFVEELAVDCWRVMNEIVNRPTGGGFSQLRIAFPEESEAQAAATMEALVRSVEMGHDWSDANPDTSVLISPDPAVQDDGSKGGVWGAASGITDRHCAVSLFSGDADDWDDAYKQMVAHEQVHCLQFADYGSFVEADDWFIEGGAEYLSHVVYPSGGNEREFIADFMSESLETALYDMSYQAWPWWQHLGNLSSPAAVFELHGRMAAGNGVDVLAAEAGMAGTFQDFTIDLMTIGIPTESAPIEASPLGNDAGLIDSTGNESETVQRFVAARFGLTYAEQHLFEQTDTTSTDGLMQMVERDDRLDRSAWRGLPPEIRSTCDADTVYLMAITTVSPDPHDVEWSVDTADQYDCDPCVGGTWLLDNDSFVAIIETMIGEQGGLPTQAGSISWDVVGPYHLRFAEDGTGNAWRDDWRMLFSGTMQGVSAEVTTTISSIETFGYSADGERFEAWNSVIVDSRATVDMGGLPISATATPSSTTVSAFGNTVSVGQGSDDGPQSAGGSYTCDEQRLEIVLDDAPGGPIRWDRVEDIPEPPVVLTDD